MDILRFDTAGGAAAALAHAVARDVRRHPGLVLGLPAGRTPVPVYAEWRRLSRAGELDFSRVRTFNLDEFVGLPASHPGSFRSFMESHLFGGIDIDPTSIGFLDGDASDLDAECRRYEAAIAGAGGIDLMLLGLGVNGHIGFNEPEETLAANTHLVRLHDETRRANAHAFGGVSANVPGEALSMGVGTILRASAIALIATGASKAAAVAAAADGPITTRLPASLLQTHRRVTLYLDREAAARLRA